MNQVFNMHRWWLLVSKHWIEHSKQYILSLVAIPAIMLAWFGFSLFAPNQHPLPEDFQYMSYIAGLYLIGCFYASMMFSAFGSTPEGIHFLSLPASHLEKLLCAVFFGIILFFVFYTVAFYATDIPMVRIANDLGYERFKADHLTDKTFIPDRVFDLFHPGSSMFYRNEAFFYFFLAYFPIQSSFLLGSVYFTKYSFIKTSIALFVIWFAIFIFLSRFQATLTPLGWHWDTLSAWLKLDDEGKINVIRLPAWIDNLLTFLFKYGFTPILWVITYFRLKEKEI